MRRLVAVLSLASIGMCSGLGLCWTQFVPRTHDCCRQESAAAPTQACGSEGQRVHVAGVAAPPIFVVAVIAVLAPAPDRQEVAAVLPARTPQLVLRI